MILLELQFSSEALCHESQIKNNITLTGKTKQQILRRWGGTEALQLSQVPVT